MDIPIHTDINPSMHPQSIRGESQGAKLARSGLTALYIAEGQIRNLHGIVKGRAVIHQKQAMAAMPKPAKGHLKMAPPLVFDPHAAAHVVESGTPLARAALKKADAAITSLGETVTRLDSAIGLKVLAGKSSRGEELRAWAARQEHPFQTLGGLFQNAHENAGLVAAVLEAEPFLSNLSVENHGHLRKVAADVLAPDEVQDRSEAAASLGQLEKATKSFTATAAEIFNGLHSVDAAAVDAIVKGNE